MMIDGICSVKNQLDGLKKNIYITYNHQIGTYIIQTTDIYLN